MTGSDRASCYDLPGGYQKVQWEVRGGQAVEVPRPRSVCDSDSHERGSTAQKVSNMRRTFCSPVVRDAEVKPRQLVSAQHNRADVRHVEAASVFSLHYPVPIQDATSFSHASNKDLCTRGVVGDVSLAS